MASYRTQRQRAAAEASNGNWEEGEQSDGNERGASEEPSAKATEEPIAEEKDSRSKKKNLPAKKKRKALPIQHESDDERGDHDDDEALPSLSRKTAKGGYAHTKESCERISKANKGKTPWNKGKNRSDAVKAKIAAGVRAQNRAILLPKLEKLGMTEDDWLAKKKEIKYLRTKIRRAKEAAIKGEVNKSGKSTAKTYEELRNELNAKLTEQRQVMKSDDEVE